MIDPPRPWPAALEAQLGAEPRQIAAALLSELDRALTAIDAGLPGGDLEAVAAAAHAARSSALMLDARPLLTALGELESGARARKLPAAHAARREVGRLWPRLRHDLEVAARTPAGAAPAQRGTDGAATPPQAGGA